MGVSSERTEVEVGEMKEPFGEQPLSAMPLHAV